MFGFGSRHCPDGHFGHHRSRGDFWPGGEHRHGFAHHHGGRLGRLFAHGDLHFVILHLIAEKPRHGYELIKAIEDRAGGTYSPSPGTIYPALTMLEEQGYLTQEPGEGSKKLYAITDEGRAYLEMNQGAVQALLARLDKAGASMGGAPAHQVIRAVENLRMALHLRLRRGPLSEEQARALAALLDQTASEIERL